MEKKVCIYKIVEKDTGKAYIGQTIDFSQRMITHFKYGSKSLWIDRAIKAHGAENYTTEIVEECPPNIQDVRQWLNEKEQFYIKLFNTFENGFNQTPGGNQDCGWQMIQHAVQQYSPDYQTPLQVFPSLAAASRDTNVSMQSIMECCRGFASNGHKHITAGKFGWLYYDDDDSEELLSRQALCSKNKIWLFPLDLIESPILEKKTEWVKQSDACRELGFNTASFCEMLKHKRQFIKDKDGNKYWGVYAIEFDEYYPKRLEMTKPIFVVEDTVNHTIQYCSNQRLIARILNTSPSNIHSALVGRSQMVQKRYKIYWLEEEA